MTCKNLSVYTKFILVLCLFVFVWLFGLGVFFVSKSAVKALLTERGGRPEGRGGIRALTSENGRPGMPYEL